MSLRQWLNNQKSPDYHWLWGYLNKRGFRLETPNGRFMDVVLEWIKQHPADAHDQDLMRDLRGAWAQRKYRKSGNRTTCNLVLSRKAKGQLKDLAKGRGDSLGEVVESLLAERKGKIPPSMDNPPAPPPSAIGHVPAGRELLGDDYPRLLEEMLLDALTDAAILKLQLDELQQTGVKLPSISIPGAIKTAKDLLSASGQESGLEGFLNIKRSLGQRQLQIDTARIERGLARNAKAGLARVIRPQSISRRLASAHLPIPTADLSKLTHASPKLNMVTDKSWAAPGAKLVITGASDDCRKFLACAISRHHCQAGVSVRYLDSLEIANALDRTKEDRIQQLIGRISDAYELLVIDDWDAIDWTPWRLAAMNNLLERRERIGATIIVSSRSIRAWAAGIEPAHLSRILALKLGVGTLQLLARPGYVYDPSSATEHAAKMENGDVVATIKPPTQIHAITSYEQIVITPWHQEARRFPAATLDLNERALFKTTDEDLDGPPKASPPTLSSNSENELNKTPSAESPNDAYSKAEPPSELDHVTSEELAEQQGNRPPPPEE